MIRTVLAVLMLTGMLATFAGCNSMGGASQDTQSVTEESEDPYDRDE